MWNFIVRRFFYSLLVVCGVMLLTFVLFNLAAGDPAARAFLLLTGALRQAGRLDELHNWRVKDLRQVAFDAA